MKMYEANHLSLDVKEIEATKVTDTRVYWKKRNGRETWSAIDSQYTSYHNSERQAWIELKNSVLVQLGDAQLDVRCQESRLARLEEKMTKP